MTSNTVEKLSFEEAMKELETIVKSLENGETSLESSIESYERGMLLKKHCENKLKEAKSKIEKISLDSEGKPVLSPMKDTETQN